MNCLNTAVKVTKRQKPTQFKVSKENYMDFILGDLKLTVAAKLVFWGLCCHYNPRHEGVFPSQLSMAQRLGITVNTVKAAIKEIEAEGLIFITKRGRQNYYIFTDRFFDIYEEQNKPALYHENKNKNKKYKGNKVEIRTVEDFGRYKSAEYKKAKQEEAVQKTDPPEKAKGDEKVEKPEPPAKVEGAQKIEKLEVEKTTTVASTEAIHYSYKKDYKAGYASYKKAEDCDPTLTQRIINEGVEKTNQWRKEYDEAFKRRSCPLDFEKEDALKWAKQVPLFARRTSKFYQGIVKKWKFNDKELEFVPANKKPDYDFGAMMRAEMALKRGYNSS